MEAFEAISPQWTTQAIHAYDFSCPKCRATSLEAERVWINRRAPVITEDYRRKWQEFYQCQCGSAWWAWSSDRPPTDLSPTSEDENL